MDEDIDFKVAMQGVRRLKKSETITPAHPKPQSKQAIREQIVDRTSPLALAVENLRDRIMSDDNTGKCNETGASDLFFLRTGIQKKILRDLKKGKHYPVQTIVDLHGFSQAEAQKEIERSIVGLYSTSNKLRCLLIIHGKGIGSANGPILKSFVAKYLKTLQVVRAYSSAQLRDGGNGALYVLIKE